MHKKDVMPRWRFDDVVREVVSGFVSDAQVEPETTNVPYYMINLTGPDDEAQVWSIELELVSPPVGFAHGGAVNVSFELTEVPDAFDTCTVGRINAVRPSGPSGHDPLRFEKWDDDARCWKHMESN